MDATLVWHIVCYNRGVHVSLRWRQYYCQALSVTVLSFSNFYCVQCSCLNYITLLRTNSLPLLLLLYLLLAEMRVVYHCCKFEVVRVVSRCKAVVMQFSVCSSVYCVFWTECMQWTHGNVTSAKEGCTEIWHLVSVQRVVCRGPS